MTVNKVHAVVLTEILQAESKSKLYSRKIKAVSMMKILTAGKLTHDPTGQRLGD